MRAGEMHSPFGAGNVRQQRSDLTRLEVNAAASCPWVVPPGLANAALKVLMYAGKDFFHVFERVVDPLVLCHRCQGLR